MKSLIYFSLLILSVAIVSGIINGNSAKPKGFPFQAGLQLKPTPVKFNLTFCGGALISDNYVLTSAQCLEISQEIVVILGDIQRKTSSNIGRKTFTVTKKNFIIHNHFRNGSGTSNDIGLIKLPIPVVFNDYIQPIILPPFSGSYFTVQTTGWGYTTPKGSLSDVLKYANLMLIENHQCAVYHKKLVQSTNICALPDPSDTICHGDIGGPLFAFQFKRYVLIGITSFGSTNCDIYTPVVSTRIIKYIDWIVGNTRN